MTDDDDQNTPPFPRSSLDSASRSAPIVRRLERMEPADRAMAERLRRSGADPYAIAALVLRDREDSDSALQEQLTQTMKEQDQRLDRVEMALVEGKIGIRWGKALGGFALGVAVAIGGFVANRMLSSEELKGEYRVRLDHLEGSVKWLVEGRSKP